MIFSLQKVYLAWHGITDIAWHVYSWHNPYLCTYTVLYHELAELISLSHMDSE